jgi:sugar (pentulose or hexulose) kinase
MIPIANIRYFVSFVKKKVFVCCCSGYRVTEGLAYEVKKRLTEMKKSGINIKRLKMIGGGAKSQVWPKIVSEITNLPVEVPKIQETASIGAALLCQL